MEDKNRKLRLIDRIDSLIPYKEIDIEKYLKKNEKDYINKKDLI